MAGVATQPSVAEIEWRTDLSLTRACLHPSAPFDSSNSLVTRDPRFERLPPGTYADDCHTTADISLISEVDKAVRAVTQNETKLDQLIMSPGFMTFEGRADTREGLDPSMTTLAGEMEGPLKENDLDLRAPGAWSDWNASVHAATMGTLALERFARANRRLSIVHSFLRPVEAQGLERARKFGMSPPNATSQAELESAELPTVDLSLSNTPEGMEELAKVVRTAMKVHGFFYVINHGATPEFNARMFDIADLAFAATTDADKTAYAASIKEAGSYQGFKARQYWVIQRNQCSRLVVLT
ncbi:hypothetical protein AURDEDRAFT_171338 [Auricularia subglabra TFB-10046 SS5]|uniref:Non-haem dioxygenase N-terminal domain-containing protein n=1 Tax=Auricularia subglabra (strain TFB-10046 / SS5) TaxID=717982 RepID=J0DC02_AURST|nr:hypothetical protein AURDEDRAFT_171338 [Auricularia subglabra TFB-10046 SS5]